MRGCWESKIFTSILKQVRRSDSISIKGAAKVKAFIVLYSNHRGDRIHLPGDCFLMNRKEIKVAKFGLILETL